LKKSIIKVNLCLPAMKWKRWHKSASSINALCIRTIIYRVEFRAKYGLVMFIRIPSEHYVLKFNIRMDVFRDWNLEWI
jgi:hypothetical protein